MRVLAINGSPRKDGNTNSILEMMGNEIVKSGVDFEVLHVGAKQIRGCVACDACIFSSDHRCVMADEEFSEWLDKIEQADGLILASPVYFANIPGTFKCFLDRVFCGHGYIASGKVAACVVVLRRTGGSAAYSELLNYVATGDMILAPSRHFNVVHGALKGESPFDDEGVETVLGAARNVAWLLKCMEKAQIPKPDTPETWNVTNFIREDLKKTES